MHIIQKNNTWAIEFHSADKTQVGRFYVKGKKLFFEGDADKSVGIFVKSFNRSLSQQIHDYEEVLKRLSTERFDDGALIYGVAEVLRKYGHEVDETLFKTKTSFAGKN